MIRVSSNSANSTVQNNASPNGSRVRRTVGGDQPSVHPIRAEQSRRATSNRLPSDTAPANESAQQFALNAPASEKHNGASKYQAYSQSNNNSAYSNEYPRKRSLNHDGLVPPVRRPQSDDGIRGQFVGDDGYSRRARQAIEAYRDNHEQDAQSHVQKVFGIDTYA